MLKLKVAPSQGPLLIYETFTAFALEARFFGVPRSVAKRN